MNILDLRQDIIAELSKSDGTFQDTFFEKFLFDAVVDLCRKTYCYTEEISDVSVVDTSTYTLTPVTTNAKLVGLISARWGDDDDEAELFVTNKRELDEQNRFWKQSTGQPSAIIYNGDDTITFNRIPDTSDLTGVAIIYEVAIAPSSIDSVVPKVIELRHLETVTHYVKWKTYEHPDFLNTLKPASIASFIKLADRFERKYILGKSRLRHEVMGEFIGNTTVKAKSFLY